VQRDDDRDRAIDRALRESLGARVTALPEMHAGEHLDGERLAAWSDGSLRPDEATMIERHLADCAHCQQLLAVFARTSPPQVTSEPLWRRWRLQWLVPIATAATAVAIWVAAPRPQPAPAALPTAAQTGERETAQTQHRIAAPAEPAPPAPSDQPREKALARVLRSPTDALAKKETLERREEPKERADESAKPSASPVPAAPQLRGVTTASENAAQTADAAPTVQGNARARDEKPARSLAEAVPTRPTPPAAPAAGAAGRSARDDVVAFSSRRTATPVEIASPNASTRWRIVGGSQVERSTNAGADWQATTPLPATGVLTTGMSPSASVCWIVGRAGIVLVTSDGLRFTRVAFPEPIDLVSVTATDDRHATVMSAGGRMFRTEDQGANWTR